MRGLLPGGLPPSNSSPTGSGQPTAGLPAEGRGKGADSVNDVRKTKAYKELRKALLDDLAARGLDTKAYTDKVDEYMDFWARRRELRDDVAERGLTVMDDRGRVSENRSVSLEVQVSRQMLALFTALGFKPEEIKAPVDDDDL